jgi:hypothetical protein
MSPTSTRTYLALHLHRQIHGALTSLSGEQGWQGDERKSPGAPQAAVASRILWPAAPAAGRSKGILGIYKCVDTFFMKIY